MKSRSCARTACMAWFGAAGLCAVLLAGCAAAPGAGEAPGAGHPAAVPPVSAAARDAVSGGSPSPSSPSDGSTATPTGAPSASAKMVCGDETRSNIARILSLSGPPRTTDTWADMLYTCTYALASGPFVLSVKEAPNPADALVYFDALQQRTRAAQPIEGMANLGFPAFQTPDGAVSFVKDNFVLTVDATALPVNLGPHGVSPSAFAYEVATSVLACWSE
ncbi:hypothetical protein [Arthrobacter sp. UYEF3]|uniref:hypothetical protein n=1 Tax=Arthrobacter sp. UYEF3 TaxID=1756365 RepID=UPI0033925965